MNKDYLLSWTTDFFDELVHGWHDRASLKKLFSLFQSWGMRRVYWIYTFKHAEGYFDCLPYKNIPTFLSPYWQSIANKPNWQKKLRQSLDDSLASGQSGLILYESAMVTKIVDHGEVELLYPDLLAIFADFRRKQNIQK